MKRSDITTEKVIRACNMFHKGEDMLPPWQILMNWTGAPEKLVYAAMQRDAKKGYL